MDQRFGAAWLMAVNWFQFYGRGSEEMEGRLQGLPQSVLITLFAGNGFDVR
jgi:hypothetical protein